MACPLVPGARSIAPGTSETARRCADMDKQDEQHISSTRARAGSTPHIMRYVLAISLGLVVLGMAIVLISSFR